MSIEAEETTEQLVEARRLARASVTEIRAHQKEAYEAGDYDEYDRCEMPLRLALKAEDEATRRLIAGVINPQGADVLTLKSATAELEDRIAKFKEQAAKLADLAVCLSILTSAIQLFSIV